MKKLIFIILSLTLCFLVLSRVWTNEKEKAVPDNFNQIAAPDEDNPSPAIIQADEPSDIESKDRYNTFHELSAERVNEIETETIRVAALAADAFINANKGESLNVVLSDADLEKMVLAIAAEGHSVIGANGRLDMQNSTAVESFGASVNAGVNAEVTFYTVYSDGHVSASLLTYADGTGSLISISINWNKNSEPEIYDRGKYSLLEIKYTDKGWLILNRDITHFNINKKFNVNSHTLVRVSAYDSSFREMQDKYFYPFDYFENNAFTTSWSEDNFGDLDFNCLFPYLYGMFNNCDPLIHYNTHQYYELIPRTDLYLIPSEDFETIITAYFDITADKLRSLADYSSLRNGYFMVGYQTGFYSVVPRTPEPEIVDSWYNDDGTLTMKVDAIFPWYGTDRAFSHELTVRDTENGGFVYVSNYFYESDANIMYECELADARRGQMNLIDY